MTPRHDQRYRRLENGLRLASECLPGALSVSFGIWIQAGSRHEVPGQEGMAHLWEHMAFKGSMTRNAQDIATALDLLGGQSNAYTGRETTCFHARVTPAHLADALDILADIVLFPRLSPQDLGREKDVILQEIAMIEDDPEDSLLESFWGSVWPGGALSHSILGTPESVRSFKQTGLRAWRDGRYRPGAMLVAAAGAVDHDAFLDMVRDRFGLQAPETPPTDPAPGGFFPAVTLRERDTEQNHVTLGFPAPSATDDSRFALSVLNTILGGNMSSRLFQEIRERRGLAYSVFSFVNSLADAGMLQIYAAVDPERTPELLDCLCRELTRMARGRIEPVELEHARDHLTSVLALSLESGEERMSRLARNRLLFDRYIPPEETIGRFAAVTLDEVRELAGRILRPEQTAVGVLGPVVDPSWPEVLRA